MSLFWKKFLILVGTSALLVTPATYLFSKIGFPLGVDFLLILLFAFALRILVHASNPLQTNLMGLYFIFLSVDASGAMAYQVGTAALKGWESFMAVLDVTVVLSSTAIGTRCFYEAVVLQRTVLKK